MTTEDVDRKPAVRRRRRAGRGGKGGMPRIMWLAVLVCVAGAVALFRTGGTRSTPSGLGENRTVVTAPETGGSAAVSDVEIEDEGLQLTPEKPVAGGELGGASNQPLEVAVDKPLNETPHVDTTVPPAGTGRAVPAEPTDDAPPPAPAEQLLPDAEPAAPPVKAAPPRLEPAAQGPYLVQAGSFGDTENAHKEADRLAKLGWPAAVKVGSKAGGGVVYRVQIGYFATREDAQAFIDQNSSKLPAAIPAHR